MRKVLFSSSLLLGLLSIIFVGCSKENQNDNDASLENARLESFSEADIVKIGDLHNEYLEKAFENFDWNATDYEQELINQFETLEPEIQEHQASFQFDYESQENNLSNNLATLESELSSQAFSYIQDAINRIEVFTTYSSLSSDLETIENAVNSSSIDVDEKKVVLVTLGVMRSSAYFWLPTDKGGSGTGYQVLVNIAAHNGEGTVGRSKLEEALAADGVSAGIGMLGVAVAGAIGPVGWVTLAIVGGEAALSSAATTLF